MNYMTTNIHDVTSVEVQYTPDVHDTGTHVRDIVIKAGDMHLTHCAVLGYGRRNRATHMRKGRLGNERENTLP